jgi:hypothetical protein
MGKSDNTRYCFERIDQLFLDGESIILMHEKYETESKILSMTSKIN